MRDTEKGPIPKFNQESEELVELREQVCPALCMDYPKLHKDFYGKYPARWITGPIVNARTGYASDPVIRGGGASGGVISQVLCYLLESGRIDGAIVAKQGTPEPLKARAIIACTSAEILDSAQSVYIPVSMLDILNRIKPGKKYAMCCLPDQSAALRKLQLMGFLPAQQVEYVVGPYTGTALYPAAISCFLRSNGVKQNDKVTSLRWRAGEWPGYLEIITESGRVLRSKKVYYNYLIPFFITQNSLQNMDFVNEFADLAVGDAWSPKFESQGGGHSVFVSRSSKMEGIISEMIEKKKLTAEKIDPIKATEMHGHMIDFKKRGGYIRNQWRRVMGLASPDFNMKPSPIPLSRYLIEIVISGLFVVARTSVARSLLGIVPEKVLGPIFNRLRLVWKGLSKPTKRKGLAELKIESIHQ